MWPSVFKKPMKKNEKELKKIKCPYCGYEMPVFAAPKAVSAGIFVRCKGRNCKKMFEVKLPKKDDL